MSDSVEKLRVQVSERREELKKALAAAERDGRPEDERAFIDLDLHTVESTLRNGWEKAVPAERAGLKKWLGETGPEAVPGAGSPSPSDDNPAK